MTSADVKPPFSPEKYAEYKQKSKEWVLNKYHTDEEYQNRQIENKRLLRINKETLIILNGIQMKVIELSVKIWV